MAFENRECPDCRVEMVAGFILDRTHGGQLIARWIEGPPEISIWSGVKAKGKDCRTIVTYRCAKCGLLRSYATNKIDPPGTWGF